MRAKRQVVEGVISLIKLFNAGIQEGETLRVEGYGMPKLMSDGRGDLFVRIHIDIPKLGFFDKFFGDGKRIKQLLEELDKLLPEPERIKEKQT